jgi:hypothetical protein
MEPEKDIFDEWADERDKKPWIVKKLRSIPLWWKYEGKYYFINFKTGLKNLWYWFPVIWKDRHWDHSFIFDIMSHKFKAQAKYIGRRDIHLNAKRDAEIMMTCVRLMKLIQDDFYAHEYDNYHKTKHWFEPTEDMEGYSTWESKMLEENFNDYFKKYPLIYKKILNGKGAWEEVNEYDKMSVAMNISHTNHIRARKLLFKIMEQNIEKWWD